MQTQISARGFDLSEELRSRSQAVALVLAERDPDIRIVKFVLEERELDRAIGVVLAFGDGGTLVRHAQANDWDRAFLELERRLERAFEE
jgi:hypothetical protein